ILFLVVALVGAGGAAWFAAGLFVEKPETIVIVEAPPPPPPPPQVLVVAEEVNMGQTLKEEQLVWREWPQAQIAPEFIQRAVRPDAIAELTGAVARARFVAGEPVLPAKLADGSSGLLAAVLRPGERALAVRISAENTAGGFVLPGDRVDVLLTRLIQTADGRDVTSSTAILRNVEVLAIDQRAFETETDAVLGKTATLRLSATQAEQLAAAESSGKLSLALRAAADHGLVELEAEPAPAAPVESDPVAEAPPAPPPPEEAPAIVVRRAGVAETVSMP
ncbi:MAG: Flp pilus assembly protein CpaB, partial [Rubrimonas sp.]